MVHPLISIEGLDKYKVTCYTSIKETIMKYIKYYLIGLIALIRIFITAPVWVPLIVCTLVVKDDEQARVIEKIINSAMGTRV